MNRSQSALLAGLGLVASLHGAHAADADAPPPGVEALEELRDGRKPSSPVQNRFFLKSKRFEVTPMIGTSPNNPFASRFSASLALGYHFSEVLSLQLMTSYMPDLHKDDVKALVPILLERAANDEFRQPFDKATLFTQIGVSWAPVYGKINILGETVLNFDFYGFLGMGFVLENEYFATESSEYVDGDPLDKFYDLSEPATKVRAAPTIGLGGNFFVTQTVAVRIDGRFGLVIDDKPIYDPEEPPQGSRVVTLFNASVGVAFFFPKMKPRLFDF